MKTRAHTLCMDYIYIFTHTTTEKVCPKGERQTKTGSKQEQKKKAQTCTPNILYVQGRDLRVDLGVSY